MNRLNYLFNKVQTQSSPFCLLIVRTNPVKFIEHKLYLIFRKFRQPVDSIDVEPVRTWTPTVLLGLMILCLAGAIWFGFDQPARIADPEKLDKFLSSFATRLATTVG